MSGNTTIRERVREILSGLPEGVTLVGAAKMRTAAQVREAVEAGLTAIGHNYVQQASVMRREMDALPSSEVLWHLIGHLQRNKASAAVALFDMIETIDSVRIAMAVDKACAAAGRTMSVLIEVNSGREEGKNGVMPEDAKALALEIAAMPGLRLQGLMTMGPAVADAEDSRPYFRLTRRLFDDLSAVDLGDGEMRYLSMGMSDSYLQAVDEGANIVRIGTRLFGPRPAL